MKIDLPVLIEKINAIYTQSLRRSLPLLSDKLWIPTNLASLLVDRELRGYRLYPDFPISLAWMNHEWNERSS